MSSADCPDASPLKLDFRLEARKFSTRVILSTDGRDEHILQCHGVTLPSTGHASKILMALH